MRVRRYLVFEAWGLGKSIECHTGETDWLAQRAALVVSNEDRNVKGTLHVSGNLLFTYTTRASMRLAIGLA